MEISIQMSHSLYINVNIFHRQISLPNPINGVCDDNIQFKDLPDNKLSPMYCGSTIPHIYVTSGSQLQIDYTTKNILPSEDFEILITSKKKEGKRNKFSLCKKAFLFKSFSIIFDDYNLKYKIN